MKNSCTGVILAGGLNSRFSGTNKAFLEIGGKKIIDHIYDLFSSLFENIILVTNDPLQYLEWDLKIVTDIFPDRSSLNGIYSGLFHTTTPYAFFTACDAPFLKRQIIETIVDRIGKDIDVVVPETSEGLEPLCAAYSHQCLKHMEKHLIAKNFQITQLFKNVRIKKLGETVLRDKDPELWSFFNINTPSDLTIAKEKFYT
jgi:molybdopterin-guanine dinucleotide biosynthesis protein A